MSRYNDSEEGIAEFHGKIAEVFDQLDVDVERRGSDTDKDSIDPTDGALFLATDTGTLYQGDGNSWNEFAQIPTDTYLGQHIDDETNPHVVTAEQANAIENGEEEHITLVIDGEDGEGVLNIETGDVPLDGFIEAITNGEAINDTGQVYETVQTAVSEASSWVFIGPGTFNENVVVNTVGLTVQGVGRETLIDGGTSGHSIEIQANDVVVRDLDTTTEGGNGLRDDTNNDWKAVNVHVRNSSDRGITSWGSGITIENCLSVDAGGEAYRNSGSNVDYINCRATNPSSRAFQLDGGNSLVSNCRGTDMGDFVRTTAPNNTIEGCHFDTGDSHGIRLLSDNNIVKGNQCRNSNFNEIRVEGDNNLVYGNHTGGGSISDDGTDNTFDLNDVTV